MDLRRTFSDIYMKAAGISGALPNLKVFISSRSFGLIMLMLAFSIESGCARLPAGDAHKSQSNLSDSPSKESCDPEADKAMRLNDFERSIKLHERFLQKQPVNRLALYHLGYAHGQIGNHEEETRYYEKAIALGLEENHIFFNLGMAYGELNQLEKARLAFEKGVGINPAGSDNYFGLALTFQRLGDDKSAEKALLQAIRIDPKDVDVRLALSLLYVDMGDLAKATDQLHKILEIDPSHEDAREFLKKIEREIEDK